MCMSPQEGPSPPCGRLTSALVLPQHPGLRAVDGPRHSPLVLRVADCGYWKTSKGVHLNSPSLGSGRGVVSSYPKLAMTPRLGHPSAMAGIGSPLRKPASPTFHVSGTDAFLGACCWQLPCCWLFAGL